MKKIFTFVCAALFAFSANAAQIAQEVEFVKAPVAQKIQKAQLSATPELKVINQEAKAPAVKLAARNLATAEPIVVIIDGTPSIQPAGGVQAITVIGKDNMVYAWGVKTTSLEAGKTYAFTDISTDYTYRCSLDYFSTFEDPIDATFSIDAENNITASMVTESGTYMVYTKAPAAGPEWTEWKKFAPLGKSTGTWTFGAVSSLSGATCVSNIYVREDKENSATQQIKVEGWGAEVLSVSGVDLIIDWDTITNVCTIAEQNTGAYQSAYKEYTMISDLNTYLGGTSYPSSYDPATSKFSLAVVYYISAGEFGWGTETLQMKSSEIKPLQYDATDADFSADFSNDDTKVSITGTTATVSATDADLKTLSLEMYVTSGSAQIPAGDYTITDSKEVGTALASEGVSGGYVTASFAGIRNAQGQITTPMWFLVEGNVNVAYNGYIMTLTVAAKNSNGKNINITVTKDYTPVVERDTVYVTSNMSILAEPTKGIIKVSAELNDTTYILEVVGADTVGTFSLANGTLSQKYYYGIVAKDGSFKSDFAEGEVTIAKEDNGYRLTGLMIGVNEKAYVLNWSKKTGVLDYDADAPFDATFAYEDMEASIKEGVIGIYATNAENYTIGLELYADPAATEIPEGVYTISDSQEAGTALKSAGVLGGYLTECYAGTRTASGGINVPCWFMVEGTVTLSYDEYGKLNVEVDAKNSYGQPVTATVVYSPATSFEEVNAEQTINKVLRNGQVLIRKNNKVYTVLGQEVK